MNCKIQSLNNELQIEQYYINMYTFCAIQSIKSKKLLLLNNYLIYLMNNLNREAHTWEQKMYFTNESQEEKHSSHTTFCS